MDDKKKLNKFEYMLLTLHLAVQDLPLEAEQLKHLIPLIDSLKKAHSEALSQRELDARVDELENLDYTSMGGQRRY